MSSSWDNCPNDVKDFIYEILHEIKRIIDTSFVGFYIHGSLAMGGFNPSKSDIDILVVTDQSLSVEVKRRLASLFLRYSGQPYPVEISFLNMRQLEKWEHPSPYDFHYSEHWRKRYQEDLEQKTFQYMNGETMTDGDLAAHLMITKHRGICIEGRSINEVIPLVPVNHYRSSIMADFRDCLENIQKNPIYCSLNMIRVLWFLQEGVISSKKEAGDWALNNFPGSQAKTVKQVMDGYANGKEDNFFGEGQLWQLRDFIFAKVQECEMGGQ
ncbi:DUF4111 domain-containing protein [Radiobacillus kanasensis]|uniref:aminoglycoside adenylyltransferase domain-containing protein n=1 Tax=Radiobacillus kanasensis TaxID=2844358 RepID=UPI001E63F2FE|nr:aminoglycoside adenylyltransferase domain-containing protein [Radiobacillus kanasensis]UFT98409.1 DUF4111 domain-containing protein [Radiobacillus kanasensis]